MIADARDHAAAVGAIATLLGTSRLGGEAVMGWSFDKLTVDSRRQLADELEDLNKKLTFTPSERPATPGQNLILRPFVAEVDRDIFAARTEDMQSAADGLGGPPGSLDDEIRSGLGRIVAHDAIWLVAIDGAEKVGMVFGELADGEVSVRIWILPDYRKRGYGTAVLRKSLSEMAAYFPPVVVYALEGVG